MSGDDQEDDGGGGDHDDSGGGGDCNSIYLSLSQGLTPPGPLAVWDSVLPDL